MKLAINGGPRTRQRLFPYQSTIGEEERLAVDRVMRSKILSAYRGSWGAPFFGGPEIRALEIEWSEKFNVNNVICCNSCTSALHIACGAIGLTPEDEVIVSPFSMTCSATAPMVFGATPVFADIEEDHYCLDPKSVEKFITKKTKAVIVVNIFGNPIDVEGFRRLKEKYGIYIIEDSAQAVGAMYKDQYSGTFGDIGCFSGTAGKHITAGEMGIITTQNDELALKCRLIMNHAESVISDLESKQEHEILDQINNKHLFGFNMRATEMQAAIFREQLRKVDGIIETKIKNCNFIETELNRIPGIKSFGARKDCKHSYYYQVFQVDKKLLGVHRDKFIEAVKAELMPEENRENEGVGLLCGTGYIRPLYRMPIFENKFNPKNYPVVESMHYEKLFGLRLSSPPLSIEHDLIDVASAFHKVKQYIGELKN